MHRKKIEKESIDKLLSWYQENKRPLPWRKDRDPYKIWISEIMLQQTTSATVKPYYHRFLQRFPCLQDLASAKEEDILKLWSGLGYYCRAKNLHKTAQKLSAYVRQTGNFPTHYGDWLKWDGIGAYTSRAISSQAFGEKVGVLDVNTIRLLSRKTGLKLRAWKKKEAQKLQAYADQCVQYGNSGEVNQALMELGALVCLPHHPNCFLCPWKKSCSAYETNSTSQWPLKKPKTKKEIWVWNPFIVFHHFHQESNKKFAFVKNDYAPFLKQKWIPPGKVSLVPKKPEQFHFYHPITHHDIYIVLKNPSSDLKKCLPFLKRSPSEEKKVKNFKWFSQEEIKKYNPSSLIQKTLNFYSYP